MNDKKSTQDWAHDWQALQKQYWSAWQDATRSATGGAPDPATPWHEGLEQWSRLFGDSGKQNETLDRLMAGAKGYMALMQSMIAAAGNKAGGMNPKDWSEAMRQGFDLPGADALLRGNPLAKMLRDIGGQGAHGIDQLSSSFAPFLAQAKSEGLSWLGVPAFGYAREHQEQYQKMAAAFVEYQDAINRYNALILKASQRSFGIFESKLGERDEPGRRIESPRALYDVWVDAAEEAYAEVALSDEFRKVYGDVVNAQMRVRSHVQAEVERVGTDLGMPTRTELNSVHRRLHEMRRAGKNGDDQRVAELERELATLRSEVAALKRARRAPANVVAHPQHKTVKTAKGRK
ncbi:MAG: class III poly(R)-hydroxyalkanoic acid synthase subunit PhaE [Proteobacteria bacterium]|nr:class III poly(R)-hydroxyalkanoic acid synthase subunit PhaE [Pseudomonadota bacterium]